VRLRLLLRIARGTCGGDLGVASFYGWQISVQRKCIYVPASKTRVHKLHPVPHSYSKIGST
jgi:hypothetical protein